MKNETYEIRVVAQLRFKKGSASLIAEETKGLFKKGDYIKSVMIQTVRKMDKPLRVRINDLFNTRIPVKN